jgi:hypothetical protein
MPTDNLTFGGYYFSTPVETVLAADTPAKAEGLTTEMAMEGFTHTDNRLTMNAGQLTRAYEVIASVTVTKPGGGSTLASFAFAVNGAIAESHSQSITLDGASDVKSVVVVASGSINAGDYFELWVSTVAGDNLTIEDGSVTIKVLG